MLSEDRFPGQISIDILIEGFTHLVRRSAKLQADIGIDLENAKAVRLFLEQKVLHPWTGGEFTRHLSCFSYFDGLLETIFHIDDRIHPVFRDLTGEIIDWRIAEYLQRLGFAPSDPNEVLCKVSHTNGRPLLFLPNRKSNPHIPSGWTEVFVEGELHEANFVKVAINVVRRKGATKNVLSEILRRWFGIQAGLPGTSFIVAIRRAEGKLVLEPWDSVSYHA